MQGSAPEGWYQSVEQAYRKAQNWEYNKQAAVRVVDPQRGTSHSQRNSSSPVQKSTPEHSKHGKGNNKPSAAAGKRTASNEPRQGSAKKKRTQGVDDAEWAARVAAGKCPACGLPGHAYKNKGQLECPNLKNGAPHATITSAKPNPNAKRG